jgi:hypothetical protein
MDQADTMRDAAVHVSALKGEAFTPLDYLPISADSHVTEPPNCGGARDAKGYNQNRQREGRLYVEE